MAGVWEAGGQTHFLSVLSIFLPVGARDALWLRNIYDPIYSTDEKMEEEGDEAACSRSRGGVGLWPRPTLFVLKWSDLV